MSERFYLPDIADSESCKIVGPEANHIAKVMRLTCGQHISVFDGKGREFDCEITESTKKAVYLRRISLIEVDRELTFNIHLGVALPKSDRQRFLIEKLTELGVSDFTPIKTERSIAKSTESNIEKFKRYVIESSKQCGRNRLMTIHRAKTLREFACEIRENRGESWLQIITDPSSGAGLPIRDKNVAGIVGPEGGLSDEEFDYCIQNGFRSAGLGRRILRTETAAISFAAYYSTNSLEI